MKIAEMGLVVTPDTWEDVDNWIALHAPEDRIHLYTAAFMAWNYACKVVDMDELDKTDEDDLGNGMQAILDDYGSEDQTGEVGMGYAALVDIASALMFRAINKTSPLMTVSKAKSLINDYLFDVYEDDDRGEEHLQRMLHNGVVYQGGMLMIVPDE